MTSREQTNADGRTILRVAQEFRSFIALALAPEAASDPDTRSLLADIDKLEEVGRWLANAIPIETMDGIPSAGSAQWPSVGTARERPND